MTHAQHSRRYPSEGARQPGLASLCRTAQPRVFARDGTRARLHSVKPGRSNGVETEVLDGLREGDRVVVYPGDKVADGSRIEPIVMSGR